MAKNWPLKRLILRRRWPMDWWLHSSVRPSEMPKAWKSFVQSLRVAWNVAPWCVVISAVAQAVWNQRWKRDSDLTQTQILTSRSGSKWLKRELMPTTASFKDQKLRFSTFLCMACFTTSLTRSQSQSSQTSSSNHQNFLSGTKMLRKPLVKFIRGEGD